MKTLTNRNEVSDDIRKERDMEFFVPICSKTVTFPSTFQNGED